MVHSSPTAVTSQAGGGGTTQRWWLSENASRHASNRLSSLDSGSGTVPLPGSTEFGPFEALEPLQDPVSAPRE